MINGQVGVTTHLIVRNIIFFKSYQDEYKLEESGRRPNKVVSLNPLLEDGYSRQQIMRCEYIIIDSFDGTKSFIRKLTDISIYGFQGLEEKHIVFSWKPE